MGVNCVSTDSDMMVRRVWLFEWIPNEGVGWGEGGCCGGDIDGEGGGVLSSLSPIKAADLRYQVNC